ncbi:MAG: HlyD family efflux transporter periplasmic adaptor subunit [Lentisphaerae bacterium]|nr:HlyD family efflux transporter periplasmic adaptor subunit [Lentisphaerota bacterium]
MKKSKKIWIIVSILLVLALLAGGYYLYARRKAAKAAKQSGALPDRIYRVKRGDLTLGVTLTGSVNAKRKHKLAMEAPWGTKLIYVVDENTHVKKGQVVARYETYELLLRIEDLQVLHDNREKDLSIAEDELKILKSSNEADIRTAKDNVIAAEDAYNKYWRLEGPRDKDNQRMSVSDAETAMEEAEDAMKEAQTNFRNTTYSTAEEEEKALTTVNSAVQKYDNSVTNYNSKLLERKIFRRYTHPNKLKSLRNSLIQAKLNLEKVEVRTKASLQQKEKQIHQIKTQIRNYKRDLDRHKSYLPMMVLKAPVDGIVIYGDPDRRWGNPEVKVGMDARRKQVIITIPDMNQLIVDVNLPEQYRTKATVGNKVTIRPDSIPTIAVNGKITKIASLPVTMIPWDKNSPKIYQTLVEFDSDKIDRRVVSGMSVQVQVISKVLPNVIFVPIEAVFEEGGNLIVYVKTDNGPEKKLVKIGEANNNFVEIKDGLAEGEEVYLYRPFQTERK